MYRYLFASLPVAALLFAQVANAAVMTYTDKTAFLNAAKSPVLESFEDQALSSLNLDPIVTPNFAMSITQTGSGILGWKISDEVRPVAGNFPVEGVKFLEAGTRSSTAPFEITFTFPNPVKAFGLHVVDFGDLSSAGQLIIGNDLGDSFVVADNTPRLANGNILFFGMRSTWARMSTITLSKTTGTDGIVIDELYISVPEPATLALFGFGLAGLGLATRRRKTA